MKKKLWLVTLAVGIHSDLGPSTVVDADTADDAVRLGIHHLAAEDESWGVECQHCESITPEEVGVVEVNFIRIYHREQEWKDGRAPRRAPAEQEPAA